jgi:hypothetical protein
MTIRYLSTAGSNTSPYTSEATAATTLTALLAVIAAGDEVRVSHTHNEALTTDGSFYLADFKGTLANPVKIISYNFSTDTYQKGAEFSCSGGTGAHLFWYGYCYTVGVTLRTGNNNQAGSLSVGYDGGPVVLDDCTLEVRTNGGFTGNIAFGSGANGGSGQEVVLRNTDMKFGAGSQTLNMNAGKMRWEGGSILAGSATPADLCVFSVGAGKANPAFIEGVDFSNFSGNWDFVGETFYCSQFQLEVRNCKLNSGWAGSLIDSAWIKPGGSAKMHNCDAGDTNYRLMEQDWRGVVQSETTVVRTGGASDGTTPLSWKMVSNANAMYPMAGLPTPQRALWNEDTGSSKTLTVEIAHDSVGGGTGSRLTDAEIALEVSYPGTSGSTKHTVVSDAKTNYLATAADQTDSSESWTTTGLTTPVKQKLAVTFTPQEKGVIMWRVVLSKPSVTVYVDSKAVVS